MEQALAPFVPDWAMPPNASALAEVVPDRAQAERFARLLFDGMTGFVNLRAIEEPAPEGRKAQVIQKWLPINEDLSRPVGDYVEECAAGGYAAYLLPHPVTDGGDGLKDILGPARPSNRR